MPDPNALATNQIAGPETEGEFDPYRRVANPPISVLGMSGARHVPGTFGLPGAPGRATPPVKVPETPELKTGRPVAPRAAPEPETPANAIPAGPATPVAAPAAPTQANAQAHPAWIPQRLPTAVNQQATEGPMTLGVRDMAPDQITRAAEIIRKMPNTPDAVKGLGDQQVLDAFHQHVVGNLLDLHDMTPAEIRERSKLWYVGGRNIVDRFSKDYGIPDHSAAGAIAAMSPQQPWDQNVSLAHRVIDTVVNHSDVPFNDDMMTQFDKRAGTLGKYQELAKGIYGKSLNDIDAMEGKSADWKSAAKALFVRMHDETNRDAAYPLVSPEGEFGPPIQTGGGADRKVAWKSLNDIGRAIDAIGARKDPAAMSEIMGRQGKIRNFYNNLLDPFSPHGDVTMDTHAIAAALMRPLSGESPEVLQNFGNSINKDDLAAGGLNSVNNSKTGVKGLYPIYADAYREAARQRGVLPREMQSITWEAIKGLFPPELKRNPAANAAVQQLWQAHEHGDLSQADTRSMIYGTLGGIKPPPWSR